VAVAGSIDPDSCHTTRFCGTNAYSGRCILGLVLNKLGGLVPDTFFTFLPLDPDQTSDETFMLTRAPGLPTTTPMVRMTGLNADKFTIAYDQCSGSPLSPGPGGCAFSIHFSPGVAGSFSAIIEASDGEGNKATMAVAGQTH
jgi:hypothetical protein